MDVSAQRSARHGMPNLGLAQASPLLALIGGGIAVLAVFAIAGVGPFGSSSNPPAAPEVVVTAPAGEASALAADPDEAEDEVQESTEPFALPSVHRLEGVAVPPTLGDATGMRIVIPKLGVEQSTVTMGIQSDGRTFQVPNSARGVAWYNFSGAPGSSSANAIFASHINYYGATGTFNQIRTLGAGDIVEIHQIDGTVYVYRVIWGKQVYKPSLSWEDVGCRPGYGCSSSNTITLITCGGVFDRATGHYVDNTVVRAELIERRKALS